MAINEDLISRRALHSAGYKVYQKFCHDRVARHAMNELEKLIWDAPAVWGDLVMHGSPAPHIVQECGFNGENVLEYQDGYECPFCGGTEVRNFCPDCGAKMDWGASE